MKYLSHYTSRDGLIGIANSGALWATNFLQLNDSSEYFYAYEALQRDAYDYAMQRIPEDLKLPGIDIKTQSRKLIEEYKKTVASSDGYGQLYVISFASGSTQDHDERGMLTLWDRYTQNMGYCVQFDRAHIKQKLDSELMKAAYFWAELVRVTYGCDKTSPEFTTLTEELGEALLLQVARTYGDDRIKPDLVNRMVPSLLERKILAYCAKHKDPFFEDEREIRLVLFPSPISQARVFTGVASAKKIRTSPTGKKYIAFGEHWKPGIAPARIIIGPRADPDIDGIIKAFNPPPQIFRADVPLR